MTDNGPPPQHIPAPRTTAPPPPVPPVTLPPALEPSPAVSPTPNIGASSKQQSAPRFQAGGGGLFSFRLPQLTPQQLAMINRWSGYGWGGLFMAGGLGAAIGYEIHRQGKGPADGGGGSAAVSDDE